MLRIIAPIALVVSLSACPRDASRPPPARRVGSTTAPGTAPTGDPRLSANAATELASALQRAGSPASVDGATVRAAGRTITSRVQIAQVIEEEVTTAVLDVALDLDGRPEEAFHVTSIAHDRNREEALQHAIREWAVACAMPTATALRIASGAIDLPDARAAGSIRLGPYDVIAGPIGARGEVPTDWDARTVGMHAALLGHIEPSLAQLIPPARAAGFHSLRFTLHVRAGRVDESDCRVDNASSERLCEAVREYPWPRSADETDGYIVKQYYVLTNVTSR